jgi:hypothetical protein
MQAFQVTENWYLTGALELEGKIDPNHILAAMLEAEGTVAEAIGAWKYLLDAAKAGTVEIAVGLQITDTEEELTVHVRNSVLHVTEGLAESVDSVVALPSSAVVSVDPPPSTDRRRRYRGVCPAHQLSRNRNRRLLHASTLKHPPAKAASSALNQRCAIQPAEPTRPLSARNLHS